MRFCGELNDDRYFLKNNYRCVIIRKKYVTLQLVMKDGCTMLNTCGLVRNTVLIIG
jgi:hypothetical protein